MFLESKKSYKESSQAVDINRSELSSCYVSTCTCTCVRRFVCVCMCRCKKMCIDDSVGKMSVFACMRMYVCVKAHLVKLY